jgi:hypothetical protein
MGLEEREADRRVQRRLEVDRLAWDSQALVYEQLVPLVGCPSCPEWMDGKELETPSQEGVAA